MKHRILIADDSLTIQKVIKITLASEPFELFECVNAGQLEESLNEVRPSIVLLDFNLSEDKTGYDLARDIKAINSDTKILMLFGTFDTIDEELLEESGVSHKIVKPFDGTKFINLCRVMADELDIEDAESISSVEEDFNTDAFPGPIVEKESEVISSEDSDEADEEIAMPEVIEEDEWVVEGSQSFDEEEIEEEIETASEMVEENPLVENMKDWGIDIPGVIGGESSHQEIPDIIASSESIASEEASLPSQDDLAFPDEEDLSFPDEIVVIEDNEQKDSEENKLPSNSDLEFPDMDNMSLDIETKDDSPQLRSLEDEKDEDTSAESLEIGTGGTDTDEALSALKAELEDELDDKLEASEDLWGADVVVEDDASVAEVSENDDVEQEEEFVVSKEEDFPRVESHQLEKVIDNTEDEKSYSYDEDSFDEVHDMTGPEDFPADVMDDGPHKEQVEAFSAPRIETDTDLEARLREKLTPVVEDFVKEYCRESVERIAWEIIPDLAENLIKKEIQRISDSIIDS